MKIDLFLTTIALAVLPSLVAAPADAVEQQSFVVPVPQGSTFLACSQPATYHFPLVLA